MKRFPWKGSYRSVPSAITAALKAIGSDLIIVSAVKKIPVQVIGERQYAHLGIHYDGAAVIVGEPAVPDSDVGRYAARNRDGWEVKRTDLPKVEELFVGDTELRRCVDVRHTHALPGSGGVSGRSVRAENVPHQG